LTPDAAELHVTCFWTFWSSTDAKEHIHRCTKLGYFNGTPNITITDELDPSSSLPDLLDDLLVTGPVQDQNCHITASKR